MKLKDRDDVILNLVLARLDNASREDLERAYIEIITETMNKFDDAYLVRWAKTYGVDYEEKIEND